MRVLLKACLDHDAGWTLSVDVCVWVYAQVSESSHLCKSLDVVSDSDIPPVVCRQSRRLTVFSVCVCTGFKWPWLVTSAFSASFSNTRCFSLTLPCRINVDGSGPGDTSVHAYTRANQCETF